MLRSGPQRYGASAGKVELLLDKKNALALRLCDGDRMMSETGHAQQVMAQSSHGGGACNASAVFRMLHRQGGGSLQRR